MAHNPVRKFITLTLLYGIIIFGIFMLQFRNELSVSKSFGTIQLRLSYANAQTADGSASRLLKNSFYAASKAATLYAVDSNPLVLQTSAKKEIPLVLQNWEEQDKTSFTLFFSEGVSLHFDGSSDQLNVSAHLPARALSLTIPYKTTETYSVTDISQSRALIKSKAETRILQAQTLSGEYVQVSAALPEVRLSPYEEVKEFNFAAIAGSDKAQEGTLQALAAQARTKLFEDFSSVGSENINEPLVAAYLAECLARGTYHDGIGSVSPSFTDGTKRTYFTAPYFNTLVKMNQTLVMERENISYRIQYSLEKNNLDVFELDRLPFVLLQRPSRETAALLNLPASLADFSPTVAQAAGILDVYAALHKARAENASLLAPVLSRCVSVLEKSCKPSDSGTLYVEDKDSRISRALTAKIAHALRYYGKTTGDKNTEAGGTCLLSSALENVASLDSRTLADLYPYIAEDNFYYPHIDVIGSENGRPVWAWTVASSIDYVKEDDGTVVFKTLFPTEETHYMILSGIEQFSSIEIYGLQYRTDPRFETYNSSGYVYNAQTKTLFLKFRHKSPVETVRLFYRSRRASANTAEREEIKQDRPSAAEEPAESEAAPQTSE